MNYEQQLNAGLEMATIGSEAREIMNLSIAEVREYLELVTFPKGFKCELKAVHLNMIRKAARDLVSIG